MARKPLRGLPSTCRLHTPKPKRTALQIRGTDETRRLEALFRRIPPSPHAFRYQFIMSFPTDVCSRCMSVVRRSGPCPCGQYPTRFFHAIGVRGRRCHRFSVPVLSAYVRSGSGQRATADLGAFGKPERSPRICDVVRGIRNSVWPRISA